MYAETKETVLLGLNIKKPTDQDKPSSMVRPNIPRTHELYKKKKKNTVQTLKEKIK